jgi:hypothetical protein
MLMSASPRLLYILPEVAYVAELLPAKQPNSFAVHSFRQINGSFITEEQLLEDNLVKLLDKLEPGEYQVLLPDFLFTDTIINVKATDGDQVKEYIKTTLLPSLEIDQTTHNVETFVLTEHKGIFKVQLSALEKSLVEPLVNGMAERAQLISSIVSVSWAMKSLISLEPSLSIVQLGEQLYLAQHYIGVDQALSVPVAEAENLIDTVKTLKGAEPSIQTIYLLSSELVAERLRQGLHDTVPLQQLAVFSQDDSQMPPYLKQVFEASMRTLSTPEYELPKFTFTATKTASSFAPSAIKAVVAEVEKEAEKLEKVVELMAEADELEADETETDLEDEVDSEDGSSLPTPTHAVAAVATVAAVSKPAIVDLTADSPTPPSKSKPAEPEKTGPTVEFSGPSNRPAAQSTSWLKEKTTHVAPETTAHIAPKAVSQAAAAVMVEELLTTTGSAAKTVVAQKPQVIKNPAHNGHFLKLFLIGLLSFVVTVGLGIGIGLSVVYFTNQGSLGKLVIPGLHPAPTVEPTKAPAASPTPTASSGAQLDPAKLKILVVNATTIPGHAGKVAQTLKTAGFTQVTTGNAKGKYDKGVFVLTQSSDAALADLLKTKSGLSGLVAKTDATAEDPKAEYAAVIVLAE